MTLSSSLRKKAWRKEDEYRMLPQRLSPPLGPTLVIGAGPAGIHVAVDLSKGWCSRLGLLNRKGSHSDRIQTELESNGHMLTSVVQVEACKHLSGEARLDCYYDGFDAVDDCWQTLILCTPSDSYASVIDALKLETLTKASAILLLSPGIGSNLLVQNRLGKLSERIEVISCSTYYAASKFDPGQATLLKSIVKGIKRKIVIGSSKRESEAFINVKRFIESIGVECQLAAHAIEAESRSITTYVHPPFFINSFSLREIFSMHASKKYMYKLYPEGPITQHAIESMVTLWKEISALLRYFEIRPLNLLKFLNDDNYPVHETTLSRNDVERFMEQEETRQQYLLYIRYSSILIDPFSEPDENGKYFDFSAVPYKQVSQDQAGRWSIPRIPYEDYKRLKLLHGLAQRIQLAMPQTLTFIELFENKLNSFMKEEGCDSFEPGLLLDTTSEEVDAIMQEWIRIKGCSKA